MRTKIDEIIKLADHFFKVAKSKKSPDKSDDVDNILADIEKLDTFAARKKLAEKNFKRLSSGSSRIVYKLNDRFVIKLAKNKKGIAQNKTESNPDMKSKYINKVVETGKKYLWIKTFYLDKITEKDFEELTDVNFKDFGNAISYGLREISSDESKKPGCFDDVRKTKVYKEFDRLGKKFKLLPGDISRISSWGKSGDNVILIDSGLSRKVFDKYY